MYSGAKVDLKTGNQNNWKLKAQKKSNQNGRFAYGTTYNSISKLYLKTLYLKIGIWRHHLSLAVIIYM